MKKIIIGLIVILAGIFLVAFLILNNLSSGALYMAPPAPTQIISTPTAEEQAAIITPTVPASPTPRPITPVLPALYDCKMELQFSSGPLAGENSQFVVLGRMYFYDKGDRFLPGKNTAIYYEDPPYLILHSAYDGGNLLKPLEAEFMRFFLEQWGELPADEISANMQSLLGTDATWTCDGEEIFRTKLNQIVRLSHQASEQLWQNPDQLELILRERPGLADEWLGQLHAIQEPSLYLSFCGWGPEAEGEAYLYYYRYLVQFVIMDPS